MEIRYSQLCFLPVFLFINGVSLQESVEGFIGGSAVLPCSSEESTLTVQDIELVLWRRNYDQNVYEIINGQVSVEGQDPVYRNRVESFPEEYLRGNFSIKLNNLQNTDAGEYWCYIFMKEQVFRIVELSIKERPERQLPSEGTKPRPEMTVLIISALFIGIISSLAVSSHKYVNCVTGVSQHPKPG
ncbi:CD276 antigen homolog isoform X2 [Carassius auratus]|uniref:CD276 antigen homolog isoform X2 n=1 Tax=Carassius auratus TaxID=7957 RepID=A0A6P6MUR2_CARAU|nr:CD276 antigen homolog isoform X2 [Carassius auratus]